MTLFLVVGYIAILVMLLLFDIQQRRILNVLALPATVAALLIARSSGPPVFIAALAGAMAGFLFFYVLYRLGRRFYGPGSLGFGDVKLAMLLGAMLGLKYVFPVLSLGMLLAGAGAVILLLAGRDLKKTTIPYGAYMASAGIIALVWLNLLP